MARRPQSHAAKKDRQADRQDRWTDGRTDGGRREGEGHENRGVRCVNSPNCLTCRADSPNLEVESRSGGLGRKEDQERELFK